MAVLIRTGDVPAKLRLDAWKTVVCDTLGPLDMRADPDVPLHGEIGAGRLGPVIVGTVRTATPHSVHRTAGLIRHDARELYRLVLVMSGSVLLTQDDHTARIRRGEFAIYDFNRPYELRYEAAVRLAVFGFPHAMLSLPAEPIARLAAVPITADDGAGAIAGPLLRRVALDLETYQPASASRLSSIVMNVVTATIAERVERVEWLLVEERQRTLLLRIYDFVEQHLGEIDLSPAVVAAAHHVSVRQIHRLFEGRHTTAAAWIRHRRLEQCRADLADPALFAVPVSAIAAKWGLPDSAQFSRMFRRRYATSPVEYRRACLMPQV
jgi:AraC-like DNA-binding protein